MAKQKVQECPCGKLFKTTRQFKRYCSYECRAIYGKRKEIPFEERECPFCKKRFIVTKSKAKQKFCSQKCFYASIENLEKKEEKAKRVEHKEKLVTVVCESCGQEFKTSKGKKICQLCKELE